MVKGSTKIIFFLAFLLLILLTGSSTKSLVRQERKTEFDKVEKRYLNVINNITKKYPLDPLFVLALIKAESGFDQWAISSVGAAGPAQLMPQIAEELGMRVYIPSWYKEAWEKVDVAKRYSKEATEKLAEISYKKGWKENNKLAMEAMHSLILANWYREQAHEIFKRYKTTLFTKVNGKSDAELSTIDERFIISKAIKVCVRFLTENAQTLGEDWRVLASSYNAGLTRVLESGGIPFLEETVTFQNRVMRFYKEYYLKNKFSHKIFKKGVENGNLYDATWRSSPQGKGSTAGPLTRR